MIIKEDYVSFKTAKLLKEKGFDGYCFMVYDIDCSIDYSMEFYGEVDICNSDCSEGVITAPSLQYAEKWLREIHNLSVRIRYDEVEDEKGQLHYKWFFDIISMNPYKNLVGPKQGYDKYEDACDEAIKYCLTNLI